MAKKGERQIMYLVSQVSCDNKRCSCHNVFLLRKYIIWEAERRSYEISILVSAKATGSMLIYSAEALKAGHRKLLLLCSNGARPPVTNINYFTNLSCNDFTCSGKKKIPARYWLSNPEGKFQVAHSCQVLPPSINRCKRCIDFAVCIVLCRQQWLLERAPLWVDVEGNTLFR
jgi:hypothetical protein